MRIYSSLSKKSHFWQELSSHLHLQTGPAFLLPARFPNRTWGFCHPYQTLDLLYAAPDTLPDSQNLGTWLALGASDLAVLFEAGWTTEGVLDALRLLLQTIQELPPLARQHLLHLNSATLIIPIRNLL